MPAEKNVTGYPSIDKPQERFYRAKPVREIETEQTIYELVFNSNKNNMTTPAIEYMGVTWTFERLKLETDKAVDSFNKIGIQKGDTVLVGMASCFEVLVTLLSLNKLGAITKWFDIRANEKDIEECANEGNCKLLIAFDMLLPKIEPIIDNTNLKKVLIVRPTDYLPIPIQALYSLKANRTPKDPRFIRFKDFVKGGNAKNNIPCVPFDKNRPSIMIQSSGTTGKPKTIVHSDYSATTSTKKSAYYDWPVEFGKEILVVLPPWIAYALGNAMIFPLAVGAKIILSPTIEPDTIIKYLGKFTLSFTAPVCYRYLKDHFDELNKKQLKGFEKVECFVSGGDKVTAEENAEFEELFKTVFINGYGNNEGWGCLTVNPANANKYGTIGIAKYGETIISFDNDEQKELPYGKVGEICALADTMFLYYQNNEEETQNVKRLHEDGNVWLHTGDLGYIDEDGYITLQGRLRRVIIRKAFKISAYTIEDKICQHPDVKECVAVEVKDEIEEHVPMAYIVLKDGIDDIEGAKQSVQEKCISELKDYEVPKYFRFVNSLPYTQNNKYDFRLLEKQGNEFVESGMTH
ncbi:MAG: acyl--CoA ligase [Clostridia bacterium]|nr:acyl--CoA ligase [Clostridia bacterium]